jgi:hypothetical protein
MVQIATVLESLKAHPKYTAMRGLARFPLVRSVVANTKGLAQRRPMARYMADLESRMGETKFPELDRKKFLSELESDGVAFGLKLPRQTLDAILAYTEDAPAYADRDPRLGFNPSERERADAAIGKPILVAQYFNTTTDCQAIRELRNDPALLSIAARYLRSVPVFVGANLWWTFPVQASEADRDKHAHLFHRDVDDFRFFKFFFYLTDVVEGEGAHVCVAGSQANPPIFRRGDKWNIRRYSDEEIKSAYSANQILEICGKAGIGFAEDTLCIHKGSTPKNVSRLLLQLQFALIDYGVMSDEVDRSSLAMIPNSDWRGASARA